MAKKKSATRTTKKAPAATAQGRKKKSSAPRTSATLTGKVPKGKRRESLKPRERTYDPQKHSSPRSFVPPDDQIVRRDKGVAVTRPKFTNRPGPLIFRPAPAFKPEDPEQWDDYKLGFGVYSFGEWLRRIPVAKYVGEKEAYTFIRYDPRDVPEGEDPRSLGLDPYDILYGEVSRRVKREKKIPHQSWLRLLDDREAVLSRPSFMFLMQAIIYMNDRKVYFVDGKTPLGYGPRDMTQVVEIPHSAGEDLVDQLNIERADYEGDPTNWHKKLKWGDIVNPATGVFVSVYNPEAWQPPNKAQKQQFTDDYREGAGSGDDSRGKGSFEAKGFRTYLSRKLVFQGANTGLSPVMKDHQLDVVVDKIQWWDEILRYPESPEETCVHIAKALRNFEDGKRVIDYGWGDHPEFKTAEVKKIMAHGKSVAVKENVPTSEDEEEDMAVKLDEWADRDTGGKGKKKKGKKRRRGRPAPEPEVEEDAVVVEDDDEDVPEPEADVEVTADADEEYEEYEEGDEDADEEGDEDEDEEDAEAEGEEEEDAEAEGEEEEDAEADDEEYEEDDEDAEAEDDDEDAEAEAEDDDEDAEAEAEDDDEDAEAEDDSDDDDSDDDEDAEAEDDSDDDDSDDDEDAEAEDDDEDAEVEDDSDDDDSDDDDNEEAEDDDEEYDEDDYDDDGDEDADAEAGDDEDDGDDDDDADDEDDDDEAEPTPEDEMDNALDAASKRSSARGKKVPVKKKTATKKLPSKKKATPKAETKKAPPKKKAATNKTTTKKASPKKRGTRKKKGK